MYFKCITMSIVSSISHHLYYTSIWQKVLCGCCATYCSDEYISAEYFPSAIKSHSRHVGGLYHLATLAHPFCHNTKLISHAAQTYSLHIERSSKTDTHFNNRNKAGRPGHLTQKRRPYTPIMWKNSRYIHKYPRTHIHLCKIDQTFGCLFR